MAGLLNAIKIGVSTGIGTFRRAQHDPTQVEGGAVAGQDSYYRLLWSYYDNSAFENMALWTPYKGQYRLYRQMRLLYNPTRRLCDFYATHVYPGVLALDPQTLPDEIDQAIPLGEDTPQEIINALGQFWDWSNWAARKGVLCRYGAIAGNVLLEIVDDVEHGKVFADVWWASMVAYLDLDRGGVVQGYALQYNARDDDGTAYLYRKEVDSQWMRYYRDGFPFDYGQGAAHANPYGFVPAVWIKHRDIGGDYGAPAIYGSIGKLDELSSLASHVHDQIHKVVGAPQILWTDGGIRNLFDPQGQAKSGQTNPYDATDTDREGILMLTGPVGGRTDSLAGNLQLHEAVEYMQMLTTEIEQDHPEVVFYRELRAMSQVTGPAATRLMGDVVTAVNEAAQNYDAGSARIFRMALAIAGWRARSGAWGPLDREQQAFTPFDLDSLSNGDLDFSIMPRPLLTQSETEKLQVEQLRLSVEAQRTAAAAATTVAVTDAIEKQ